MDGLEGAGCASILSPTRKKANAKGEECRAATKLILPQRTQRAQTGTGWLDLADILQFRLFAFFAFFAINHFQ
jgi:hypothetical protein